MRIDALPESMVVIGGGVIAPSSPMSSPRLELMEVTVLVRGSGC